MAARSPEHPKVLLTRTLSGFEPATAYDSERLSAYGIGHTIEATLWQRRSPGHHRLYWVVLSICTENSEGKYGAAEDLLGFSLHDSLHKAARLVHFQCPGHPAHGHLRHTELTSLGSRLLLAQTDTA